ncbi:uncharacterized protein AMSG_00017 [Thecamonas trahens ATCC 50062]|uniref:Choline transporter-like protein n=1 Tax=Thecamonas trahens ATCC 50062 TaxID=461836 RepID=A0A0L0D3M6_THETB|nr:hypothetical protein AMSG_00017 [Thecamonas trahens ATCC 50062]KNC45903.1 hypothetical protein AMSG_00017 [Thecamonas trahens ATCC 50062]|eukprot:XP_013762891.1 hypothetical protein AMSG_00017 [Thecamonas trahens ATCC 50062]
MALSRAGAGIMIPVCMVGYIVLLVAVAVVLFAAGILLYGIMFLVLAGLYGYFFYSWRDRLEFSKAMLRASTTWVFGHPASFAVAAATLVVLVAWLLLWSVVVSAPLAGGFSSTGDFGLAVFLLLSLYWTTQVIRNVMHVTVSGGVAAWYFAASAKGPGRANSPLASSLKRAMTTSLGPICFGSLVVAILKTIRSLVRYALNAADSRGFLACVINMILSCIESLMELFNVYAFTQVAIYGKSYIRAAKDTFDLINSHGVSGIINEVLTGLVFFFGAIAGALVCGAFSALWATRTASVDGEYTWITAGIGGLIIGYIIVAHVMELPDSFVAAQFVLLAEEPEQLPLADPALADAYRDSYGFLIPASAFRAAERAASRSRRR